MNRLRAMAARPMRFVIVGGANTAVYYVIYRLLLPLMAYLPAHLIAFGCGVVFSFFANCLFTYRVRPTWRRFFAFPATTLVNLAVTTGGSALMVHYLNVDERYVTLIATIIAVPFTYVATTFVLADRKHGHSAGRTAGNGARSADDEIIVGR